MGVGLLATLIWPFVNGLAAFLSDSDFWPLLPRWWLDLHEWLAWCLHRARGGGEPMGVMGALLGILVIESLVVGIAAAMAYGWRASRQRRPD